MADQGEQYEKSWILYHILDRFIGSPEILATRRSIELLWEYIRKSTHKGMLQVQTGSFYEGIEMTGSDIDNMLVDTTVEVTYPFHDSGILLESKDKTVFIMRDAPHSRPGYVTLELVNLLPRCNSLTMQSIVRNGDRFFISSEICRKNIADRVANCEKSTVVEHGPAATYTLKHNTVSIGSDLVYSFPCSQWPLEAYEWVSRPRLHGWPDKASRDQIVQGGCHLVPVGDRTSADTFLQWRISFTAAEKKLVHSLTHTQFLVYGLHKYFLKQISDRLKQIFGDEDILSSYIIKTVIFYVVESTPDSLWQEKNTFFCFILCLKVLIAWVNAGYCPNYFISNNNMFLGKVHGENQQKLLHILVELYNMKWECLSVGTAIQPSIGKRINSVRDGAWQLVLSRPTESERNCDIKLYHGVFIGVLEYDSLPAQLSLLSKSKSDIDEFIAYITAVRALSYTGMGIFEKHIPAKGNKEKYKYLRKSKNLMQPLSTVCTSPGLLTLATYYYQTGNYKKTLEICEHMMSSFQLYILGRLQLDDNDADQYESLYCGRGYTLLHKCKDVCVASVFFPFDCVQFCPYQLHPEFTKGTRNDQLLTPPLPYAVFLTFLCHHELGDTRRRDAALTHLQAVKYDKKQGVGENWIVHNFLGICHEMVGDTRQALREYRDSMRSKTYFQFLNGAKERIERLQHSQ
ncbi:uncharacterized protein LOC110462357 [Mizuhopecten yessoensis]|uniref:Cyclic GMP-AMP synthase n=1 Tax=Mizuhopecten yessoensis TaxID=6573 RepID=A0A210PYD5_MIZYE|nr:uncharacterized protein LOC110462357 [Mizuhopecten yessoensis]OWF41496.1 Cyclic GMP-AMP synthase [Mizuhopecten yessoensis]